MTDAKLVAKWTAINGAFAALVYLGAGEGVEWAGNVVLFAVPALFVFSLLVIIATSDDDWEYLREGIARRSVPQSVNWAYDVAVALYLAAFGWFVTASLWIVANLLFAAVKQRAEEQLSEEDPEPEEREIIREARKVVDHDFGVARAECLACRMNAFLEEDAEEGS